MVEKVCSGSMCRRTVVFRALNRRVQACGLGLAMVVKISVTSKETGKIEGNQYEK